MTGVCVELATRIQLCVPMTVNKICELLTSKFVTADKLRVVIGVNDMDSDSGNDKWWRSKRINGSDAITVKVDGILWTPSDTIYLNNANTIYRALQLKKSKPKKFLSKNLSCNLENSLPKVQLNLTSKTLALLCLLR